LLLCVLLLERPEININAEHARESCATKPEGCLNQSCLATANDVCCVAASRLTLGSGAGGQFEVLSRLHGPEKSFFDNTIWKLPDIRRVN
jgi:hypothetical protein